jgi:AraC-like DNA-binding protein
MNALDLIAELISKGHATGESLPPKMLEIKSYIDENYAEIESVSDVAKNFFYSREYVSRLFKKYYSVSVSDYLARVRVIRSIEMMQGGVSVTDACFAVGFGSMSAFYLTFRKNMGMSPSEYAKRQRENTNK